jgi:hypothetical protein
MIIGDVNMEIDPNYPYVLYFIHNILIHRLCRRFIVNRYITHYINSLIYIPLVIHGLDTVYFFTLRLQMVLTGHCLFTKQPLVL